MKTITFLSTLFFSSILLFTSCNNGDSEQKSGADTNETANEKLAEVSTDFQNYPQYVSCKIDGQPYVAYYSESHIGGITNSLNMASQVVFSTSADQVQINGKTKISQLDFSFFTLNKTGAGTLTSNTDFYFQGHTDFPEGGSLKYVSFTTKAGQQLVLTSFKDGLLEGTFSFDVVDEKDPAHILKITEGVFKLQQEGKTSVKTDKNGDVNMDSLIKSIK